MDKQTFDFLKLNQFVKVEDEVDKSFYMAKDLNHKYLGLIQITVSDKNIIIWSEKQPQGSVILKQMPYSKQKMIKILQLFTL